MVVALVYTVRYVRIKVKQNMHEAQRTTVETGLKPLPRPLGYDHPLKKDGPLYWLQREQISPEAAFVHEKFVKADQYQFYLHGALGDTTLQMAYVRGMIAAIKRLRPDNPPITVIVPPHVEPLARYTIQGDDPQITLTPLYPSQDKFRDYLTAKAWRNR